MLMDHRGVQLREGQRVVLLVNGPVECEVTEITSVIAPAPGAAEAVQQLTLIATFRFGFPSAIGKLTGLFVLTELDTGGNGR